MSLTFSNFSCACHLFCRINFEIVLNTYNFMLTIFRAPKYWDLWLHAFPYSPPLQALFLVLVVVSTLSLIFKPQQVLSKSSYMNLTRTTDSRCVNGATGNAALCNVTQEFYCGMAAMDDYVHNENGRAQCNCPPQCFHTVYDVTSSQALYSDYYLDFMA